MTVRSMQYGWSDAEAALADGIHPEVVAARLGEPIDHVLEVADERGWPITWDGRSKRACWAPEIDA